MEPAEHATHIKPNPCNSISMLTRDLNHLPWLGGIVILFRAHPFRLLHLQLHVSDSVIQA